MIKKLLFILIVGILTSGCIANQTEKQTNTPIPTTTEVTTAPNISVTAQPITTAKNTTIKCELCHTNPENISFHVNGGKLCINCHGSQVHDIHTGAGTVNLDCKTCHGYPPTIPKVAKGEGPGHYSICERCHAPPPNNTEPSYGNLIIIHMSRGKYCTNCHGTDIGVIHTGVITNATKRSGVVANKTVIANTTNTNRTNITNAANTTDTKSI